MQRAILQPTLQSAEGIVASQFSMLSSLQSSAVCSFRRNCALGVGIYSGSVNYEPTFVPMPFSDITSGTFIGIYGLGIFLVHKWARCFQMSFMQLLKVLKQHKYNRYDTWKKDRNILF